VILVRSLLFQVAFYGATAVLAVVGLPLLLAPWRVMMRFGTAWSRLSLDLLKLCAGLDWEVRGRANLPRGPCLIAMKHQSAWDTLAVPVLFDLPAIVIKRELGWIPFYGWYARHAGMIALDRSGAANALRRMLAEAAAAVANGRPIVIFPEGTRTAVGAKPRYLPGVFAVYRELNLPLVPVAVNSGLYWGRRAFVKRPGRIVVEILPPIPSGGTRREVMATLETAIETATASLVAEAAAEKPVDSRDRGKRSLRG
jgi:1-acyl-sn-glycerol-3-phosphate acyltransferase